MSAVLRLARAAELELPRHAAESLGFNSDPDWPKRRLRSEEHTSELQSPI